MNDTTEALPPLHSDGFWEERMKTIQAECGAPDTPEVWHAMWRVRDELERWAIRYARAALAQRQQAVPSAQAEPLPCGQCRKADSWGIPLSKTCVYDCKFEPLNAAPPAAQAEPHKGRRYEAGDWSMRNYEAWLEDQQERS